jgi:hypothetical protein
MQASRQGLPHDGNEEEPKENVNALGHHLGVGEHIHEYHTKLENRADNGISICISGIGICIGISDGAGRPGRAQRGRRVQRAYVDSGAPLASPSLFF